MKANRKARPKRYKNYEDFLKQFDRRYLSQDEAAEWLKALNNIRRNHTLSHAEEHAIMGIKSVLIFLSVDLTNAPVFTNDN